MGDGTRGAAAAAGITGVGMMGATATGVTIATDADPTAGDVGGGVLELEPADAAAIGDASCSEVTASLLVGACWVAVSKKFS